RRQVRRSFDGRVEAEWGRYAGNAQRVLRRTLRERFLTRHLGRSRDIVLELGPGPGRFTSVIRRSTRTCVAAVDLSLASLRSARRRTGRQPARAPIDWIQGAGELLPFRNRTVDAAVVLGNIVNFAAADGPALLQELGRVVKRQGLFVADFASPAGATHEFFHVAAQRRLLRRILRRPNWYFVDQVLRTGYQPYAPTRLARWEFRFYTVGEVEEELARAGFRAFDAMSIAPVAAFEDRVAAIARREPRTWENLLRTEEKVGRRVGALETGHGFMVAAVRR
ncbi:MAG: class I SAM-dependent methyltransferase, partial [Thermoplasmata archaeon]|nr:class I SAM-dependent methyltransferase [Thermoplasmata archaeon]